VFVNIVLTHDIEAAMEPTGRGVVPVCFRGGIILAIRFGGFAPERTIKRKHDFLLWI